MRAFLPALVVAFALSPFATVPALAAEESQEVLLTWLPKLDATQRLAQGQVVGLFGGGLSLSTAGAGRALVAGAQGDAGTAATAAVVLSGRVSVNVVGAVRAGQLLFASGRNDGTAQALPPAQITPARLPLLLGRALDASSGEGTRTVSALVGLPHHEVLADLLDERDAILEAQEVELVELRSRVETLDDLEALLDELRDTVSRLEAAERQRRSEQLAPPEAGSS